MKEYKFKINGSLYNVSINSLQNDTALVVVNGREYIINIESVEKNQKSNQSAESSELPKEEPGTTSKNAIRNIKSPLPGIIVEINVKPGDSVKKGQKIAVIEAMKMENEITADCDGVVSEIKVKVGDSVLEGAVISTMQQ
ncbi:MAG: biotin/lipoyl-containing protein [Candidatus Cryptobacteroides sp.]